jgi:hypothetical protein
MKFPALDANEIRLLKYYDPGYFDPRYPLLIKFILSQKKVRLYDELTVTITLQNLSSRPLLFPPHKWHAGPFYGSAFYLYIAPELTERGSYTKSGYFFPVPDYRHTRFYTPLRFPLKEPLVLLPEESRVFDYPFILEPALYGQFSARLYFLQENRCRRSQRCQKILKTLCGGEKPAVWIGKYQSINTIRMEIHGLNVTNALNQYALLGYGFNRVRNEKDFLLQFARLNLGRVEENFVRCLGKFAPGALGMKRSADYLLDISLFDTINLARYFAFDKMGTWAEKTYNIVNSVIQTGQMIYNICTKRKKLLPKFSETLVKEVQAKLQQAITRLD